MFLSWSQFGMILVLEWFHDNFPLFVETVLRGRLRVLIEFGSFILSPGEVMKLMINQKNDVNS